MRTNFISYNKAHTKAPNDLEVHFNKGKFNQLVKECLIIKQPGNRRSHKPRLMCFDKDERCFKFHDVYSQQNSVCIMPELEEDITEFSYIDINDAHTHNQLFIIGGEIRSSINGELLYSNKTFVLNETNSSLIEKCPMKYGRCGHRLNCLFKSDKSLNQIPYIVATGTKYPEEKSSSVEIYNVAKNQWKDGPDLNCHRFNHTSVVVNDSVLYVIGGLDPFNEKRGLESIEKLDFTDPHFSWEEIEYK